MRERRVVPLRLMPTMKMGESVEDVVGFKCVAPASVSDIKEDPLALLPRLVLSRRNFGLASLSLCSDDLKAVSGIAMH